MTRDYRIYRVRYDRGEEVWTVELEADARPSSTHATKAEAVSIARGAAQGNQPSKLIVHRQDGSVQENIVYGDDPALYPS